MKIPKSCEWCKYGTTRDMSIDDLITTCYIVEREQEWLYFPKRYDNTLRCSFCPLPNVTQRDIEKACKAMREIKQKRMIFDRMLFAKKKSVRLRNRARFEKMIKNN